MRLFLLALVAVSLLLAAPAEAAKKKVAKKKRKAAPVVLAVKSLVLVDMTAGKTLYSRDAELAMQPASITKVLSLYLVYDAVDKGKARWSDRVRISPWAGRTGGTRMHLEPNTEATLEELATGMAVVSANDASVAVAEHLGGSVEAFVEQMNRQARILGMTRSCFKTPHGLPAKGQYTTAVDIVRLSTAYLERFPASLAVHALRSYSYHGITQTNRNRLLGHYPGADGLKTGYVGKAGWHIAATAKHGDTRMLAVVMGANNPNFRNREAEKLLDRGFAMVSGEAAPTRKGSGGAAASRSVSQ